MCDWVNGHIDESKRETEQNFLHVYTFMDFLCQGLYIAVHVKVAVAFKGSIWILDKQFITHNYSFNVAIIFLWSFSRVTARLNTPTVQATSVTKHFRRDMTTDPGPAPFKQLKNHLILTPGHLLQTLQLLLSDEFGSWAAQLRERCSALGNRNTRLQFPEHSLELNSGIQPRLLCQTREREGGSGRALSELMTCNLLAENRRGLLKLLSHF